MTRGGLARWAPPIFKIPARSQCNNRERGNNHRGFDAACAAGAAELHEQPCGNPGKHEPAVSETKTIHRGPFVCRGGGNAFSDRVQGENGFAILIDRFLKK